MLSVTGNEILVTQIRVISYPLAVKKQLFQTRIRDHLTRNTESNTYLTPGALKRPMDKSARVGELLEKNTKTIEHCIPSPPEVFEHECQNSSQDNEGEELHHVRY